MYQEVPTPRNRPAGSCSECRRRKQKCDREQPCNHCRRRFPEPECTYPPNKKPGKKKGTAPARPYTRKVPIPRASSPKHRPQSKRRNVIVARWSGVNLTTEYPIFQPDLDNDSPVWEAVEESQEAISARISTTTTELSPPLRPARKALSFSSPHRQNVWRFAGPVDGMALAALPIAPTHQNAMLVHTFAKLLYHFKGSFDGDPDADNPFITDYVPWCIQSPLLAQTSLYISARSLTENQHVDRTSAMRMKGAAIHTLNSHLQSEDWASDEALAGVVQFVSIEWFFGEPDVVLAHLRGLREMVRLRGGFTGLGVGALVTKVALVDDAVIAMSLESNPILQQGPGFDFGHREQAKTQLKLKFTSPFLAGSFAFSSRAKEMGIHPSTAAILDDMQFLINAVLGLSKTPSDQEQQKLRSTGMWIYERISKFPVNLVEGPSITTPEDDDSTGIKDSSTEASSLDNSNSSIKPHSLLPQYPEFTASSRSSTTASSENTLFETPISARTEISPPTGSAPNTRPVPESSTESGSGGNSSSSSQDPIPDKSSSCSSNLKNPRSSPSSETPNSDPLYTAVRLAAALYARAISARQPFSRICKPPDALQVLGATWRIPLSHWRGVIGPLLFTLISIIATVSGRGARGQTEGNGDKEAAMLNQLRPHAGFVKSILQIGFMQISLEDWEVCRETMARVLRLLEWLRGPSIPGLDDIGKTQAVESEKQKRDE